MNQVRLKLIILCGRGFNDAINGFSDDGWSLLGYDGVEDVTITINSSPSKLLGSHSRFAMLSSLGGGILCAKASMLLQVYYLFIFLFSYHCLWYKVLLQHFIFIKCSG